MDPFPAWARKLWDMWDIRVLVLVSFTLQIILVHLGSRRRYITGIWIRITVWSAYLMADWVATVSLGKLSDISSIGPDNTIMALWAPLLLVHLGGPDTITAYSIEDNQLWVRHALGLVVQAAVVVFVILKYWTSSHLSSLTIPLFFAGIIKYIERTWALWSTTSWKAYPNNIGTDLEYHIEQKNTPSTIKLLIIAFERFNHLKPHVRDWNNLRTYVREKELEAIRGYSPEDIFKITEYELGFAFDALYTKASVIHITIGIFLRFVTTFCMHFSLWKFLATPKSSHADVNVTITYVLLVGAVVLDLYALALAYFFDMAIIWKSLPPHERILESQFAWFVGSRSLSRWRPWSNSMGQFSLISSCMIKKPMKCSKLVKFIGMYNHLEKYYQLNTRKEVTKDLKKLIIQEIDKFEERRNAQPFKSRGKWALEMHDCFETLGWSIESDFGRCMTLWHIATDICYYCDDDTSTKDYHSEMGKCLSDYMMYLLVMYPYMLPTPFRDVELILYPIDFYLEIRHPKKSNEKDEALWLLHTEERLDKCCFVIRNFFESSENRWYLMGDARRLAKTLLVRKDKWNIVCSMWVEMMCYAASHCELDYHFQQLRHGGELLTHVWLLLSHMTNVIPVDTRDDR